MNTAILEIAPPSMEMIGLIVGVVGLYYAAVSYRASVSQAKQSISPLIGIDAGEVAWEETGSFTSFACSVTIHNTGLGNAFKASLDFTLHYTRTDGVARGGYEHNFGTGALTPGGSYTTKFSMPLIDAWILLNDYSNPALTIVASWEDGSGGKFSNRFDYLVFQPNGLDLYTLRRFRRPPWLVIQIRKILGSTEPSRSLPA